MKPVTERLQRMRFERKRLTQREVAHRAGMSVAKYWEIENGYRPLEGEDLKQIAKAFRCSQAEILGTIESESVAS